MNDRTLLVVEAVDSEGVVVEALAEDLRHFTDG